MSRRKYMPVRQNWFHSRKKPEGWFNYETYAKQDVADRIEDRYGKHWVRFDRQRLPYDWWTRYELWDGAEDSLGGTVNESNLQQMFADIDSGRIHTGDIYARNNPFMEEDEFGEDEDFPMRRNFFGALFGKRCPDQQSYFDGVKEIEGRLKDRYDEAWYSLPLQRSYVSDYDLWDDQRRDEDNCRIPGVNEDNMQRMFADIERQREQEKRLREQFERERAMREAEREAAHQALRDARTMEELAEDEAFQAKIKSMPTSYRFKATQERRRRLGTHRYNPSNQVGVFTSGPAFADDNGRMIYPVLKNGVIKKKFYNESNRDAWMQRRAKDKFPTR